MAFILTPQHGEKVYINAWNWRPTLEILRAEHLVDDETPCGGVKEQTLEFTRAKWPREDT